MNKRKNISSRSSLRLRSLFLISVSILPILTTSSTSVAQSPTPNPGMSTQANLQRALVLPQEVIKQQVEIAANMVRPRGALPWNRTSDFMLGTVAVAIILPQCVNGAACRETWTQAEINEVRAEVQSGLDWWTQKAAISGANVQFQLVPGQPQVVNLTNIEPIRIPGGNSAALCGDEGRWIDAVMMALGYNAYPPTGNQYLTVCIKMLPSTKSNQSNIKSTMGLGLPPLLSMECSIPRMRNFASPLCSVKTEPILLRHDQRTRSATDLQ